MSVNEQSITVVFWLIYSVIRNIKTNRFALFNYQNVHYIPLYYIKFHAILLQYGWYEMIKSQ